jgi:hypothetical protein
MITIAFSSHRAEIISFARQIMEQHLIESVKAFAAVDAKRSNFRSKLRSGAIAALDTSKKIYVESGYIQINQEKTFCKSTRTSNLFKDQRFFYY